MIVSSDGILLWFVGNDVSWHHLLGIISNWSIKAIQHCSMIGLILTSILLIARTLREGVVCSRLRLQFPISFINFPGWSSHADFLWDPDSFLLPGQSSLLFLFVFLCMFWRIEYFFVWKFRGHYSVKNIDYIALRLVRIVFKLFFLEKLFEENSDHEFWSWNQSWST